MNRPQSQVSIRNITYRILFGFLILFPLSALAQDIEVSDPIEPFNRAVFWFNDKLDVYVLEPVARGYDEAVPQPIQDGIGNFFKNLRYPAYLVSDLVQLKFGQAWQHTERFVVNSTVGLAGLIDVAKHIGIEDNEEDFGLALAYHGVPSGPYLVLPILGPSNLRDGFGRLVDFFLDPVFYIRYTNASSDAKFYIPLGVKTVQLVDTRADLLEAVQTAKESSLDYYLFVQGAYYQHRRGLLYDGHPPDEDEDQASTATSPDQIDKTNDSSELRLPDDTP